MRLPLSPVPNWIPPTPHHSSSQAAYPPLPPPRVTHPCVFHPEVVRREIQDGDRCVHSITTHHDYYSLAYFRVSNSDKHTSGLALPPARLPPVTSLIPQVPAQSAFPSILTSPRLPQELCDIIMDELGRLGSDNFHWNLETRALKQCALVCRAWTPRAQLWLFRFVSLGSVESLRKLEVQLCLREEYVPEIQAICILIAEWNRGYPIRNLASAVTTLARKCSNLRVLEVDGSAYNGVPGYSANFHSFFPFQLRIHSALYRQSFSTITDLRLVGIFFHSDTDLLRLILSFPALRVLTLWRIHCNILERVKEVDYILQLKKRKGVLGRLSRLEMVCDPGLEIRGQQKKSSDTFIAWHRRRYFQCSTGNTRK